MDTREHLLFAAFLLPTLIVLTAAVVTLLPADTPDPRHVAAAEEIELP